MKKKEQVIEKLQKEIKKYEGFVERDAPIGHFKTAEVYEKLFKETNEQSDSDKALFHFTKAIDITRPLGEDAKLCLYLARRSKLYVERGETDSAVADMMEASSLPESQENIAIVGRNILRDVSRISAVQDTIKALETSGEISAPLAQALREHANVTASLVLQVSSHETILGEHGDKIKQLEERAARAQQQESLITNLQNEIQELKIQTIANTIMIKAHNLVLSERALQEKDAIIAQVAAMESNPILYNYYKTFYWAAMDLFSAQKIQHQHTVQSGTALDQPTKHKIIMSAIDLAAKTGSGLAPGMPLSVEAMEDIDKAIDYLYRSNKQPQPASKTAAINSIIDSKLGLEGVSLNIAKITLALTKARESEILKPHKFLGDVVFDSPQSIKNWAESKAGLIAQKITRSAAYDDQGNIGASLALQDLILLIACLCKDYNSIIGDPRNIDEQCAAIIGRGELTMMGAAPAPILPDDPVEEQPHGSYERAAAAGAAASRPAIVRLQDEQKAGIQVPNNAMPSGGMDSDMELSQISKLSSKAKEPPLVFYLLDFWLITNGVSEPIRHGMLDKYSSEPGVYSGKAGSMVSGQPLDYLFRLIKECAQDAVRWMLSLDPSLVRLIDEDGRGAVHMAAKYGQNEILAILINEYKADIDQLTEFGDTPILCAADYYRAGSLYWLRDKGANLSIRNNGGDGIEELMRKADDEGANLYRKIFVEYDKAPNEVTDTLHMGETSLAAASMNE